MTAKVAPATTHRAEQELGQPIENGILRWASASLITQADPNSEGGCLRRMFFERVLGKARDQTAAQSAGQDVHTEIETYLKTGALTLGPVALAGRHFIPEPGPGLSIEQPIILGGNGKIDGVWLWAAGVPIAGHVDIYNHRGEYLDREGDLRRDPPNTLEVKDWKTTSDLKWAKSADQVAATIQMNTYAMAGFRMWPRYEEARLTHVYFQRNGRPQARLATSRPKREQIERRWEYAVSVVRTIIHAAAETDAEKVPANVKACHSYNKACPHLVGGYCSAGYKNKNHDSLEDILGPRMAARIDARLAGNHVDENDDQEDLFMGVLDKVKTSALNSADGVGVEFSLDSLLAEEDAGRAELAPVFKPAQPTKEFTASVGAIHAAGLGFPPLAGVAAQMYGVLNKHASVTEDYTVAGKGKLEKLPAIDDPVALAGLAAEIQKKLAAKATPATTHVQRNTVPVDILPPDAPPSTPALAADPVEGLDNAKARELAAARTPDTIPGLVESVAAAAVITTPAPTETAASSTAPTEQPKAKRGRPPGSGKKKTDETTPTIAAEQDSCSIFLDCVVAGVELESLEPYVAALCKTLCDEYKAVDVRCAPADSPLSFAKWRGAVAGLAIRNPPPNAMYNADTRGNEVVELVAVALRAHCVATGGIWVRGLS